MKTDDDVKHNVFHGRRGKCDECQPGEILAAGDVATRRGG